MPSRCPGQEFVPASHLSGRNPNDQEEPSFQGKKPVSMLGRAGDAYMVNRPLATGCSRCGRVFTMALCADEQPGLAQGRPEHHGPAPFARRDDVLEAFCLSAAFPARGLPAAGARLGRRGAAAAALPRAARSDVLRLAGAGGQPRGRFRLVQPANVNLGLILYPYLPPIFS